ncbi:hypothetical protein GHV40_16060 [Devosia sp. D6-9]|nr:hypothetical protein GHV40_16060 [Devosia sp. D6-9]
MLILACAIGLTWLIARIDAKATTRLLPDGAFRISRPLSVAHLMIGMQIGVYVPFCCT